VIQNSAETSSRLFFSDNQHACFIEQDLIASKHLISKWQYLHLLCQCHCSIL